MNRSYYVYLISSVLFILVLAFSCEFEGEQHHGLLDKVHEESEHYHGTTLSSEKYIEDLKTIEVTEDGQTFSILSRKDKITSFACSECHTKPLPEKLDSKKAHWNIQMHHADENTMNCRTCHDTSNPDSLLSLTGRKIDFEKSYLVCSQCHQKQKKDWSGGAHGKRIGGWAPPRVSQTCVGCHNPHAPGFEPRWPASFNTQKVKDRK